MPLSVSIMTAETLKPFITPTSAVDNFPATQSCGTTSRSQHKRNLVMIALTVAMLSVAGILLGFTIWHSMRVTKLETDLAALNNIIESLQKRLGITYLDDLHDFEKEYANALIDDPNTLDDADIADDNQDDDNDQDDDDDDEDDDDDDEDDEVEYGEYTDLIKKYEDYGEDGEQDEEEIDASDKDNLFDDFEKFQDSKNKNKQRKQRSIAEGGNEIQKKDGISQQNKTHHENTELEHSKPRIHSHNFNQKKTQITSRHPAFIDSSELRRTTTIRTRTSRRRKLPVLKSGESLISAKSSSTHMHSFDARPAAHFHLNRKVSHHNAAIKLDSYPGDMYIGHPSSTNNEQNWQQYFNIESGVLTVRGSGLYYVYAQICYNNTHDQNGFVIFHGHKPFLQCLNTVPTNMPFKIHTCHTSGLIYLQENETLHLRDFHSDRNVILKDDNNRSYFGLIKV